MKEIDLRRLALVAQQLTENLSSAVNWARELRAITNVDTLSQYDPKHENFSNSRRPRIADKDFRPLLDESTLTVFWQGQSVWLGSTQAFWLLARLSKSINRYVSHAELLGEIWGDDLADSSVLRAGVKRLRFKLRASGMADLARAIRGHNGRYMLDLKACSCHADVTAMSQETSHA